VHAYHVRVYYEGKTNQKFEYCEKCGQMPSVYIPDVSFQKPYFDEHLCDKSHPQGQWIHSKRQKAELLRQRNLVEAGDRINPKLGYPTPFIKDEKKRQKFFKDNFG
jgi:hypothetical protein